MMTKDGKTHYVPTPLSRTTLEADKRAFVALMRHIREIDPQHTVIIVQVENEVGSYGSHRAISRPKRTGCLPARSPPSWRARSARAAPGRRFRLERRQRVQRLVHGALYRRDRGRRPGGAQPADVRQCRR